MCAGGWGMALDEAAEVVFQSPGLVVSPGPFELVPVLVRGRHRRALCYGLLVPLPFPGVGTQPPSSFSTSF